MQLLQWPLVHLLPLPQHPNRPGKILTKLPWEGFPSTSSPTVHSPTKRKCTRSPSPCTARSLALPPLAGAQHPLADWEVIWARQGHWAPVMVRAVAVGPAMGPQQDPKPAQMRDLSTHEQHQVEVSKSSLQMRPVRARRMPWTLPRRQTLSQRSMSLPDISAADDEDTCKRKARELAHKSNTDFVSMERETHPWRANRHTRVGQTEVSMTMLTLERGGLRTLTL